MSKVSADCCAKGRKSWLFCDSVRFLTYYLCEAHRLICSCSLWSEWLAVIRVCISKCMYVALAQIVSVEGTSLSSKRERLTVKQKSAIKSCTIGLSATHHFWFALGLAVMNYGIRFYLYCLKVVNVASAFYALYAICQVSQVYSIGQRFPDARNCSVSRRWSARFSTKLNLSISSAALSDAMRFK